MGRRLFFGLSPFTFEAGGRSDTLALVANFRVTDLSWPGVTSYSRLFSIPKYLEL